MKQDQQLERQNCLCVECVRFSGNEVGAKELASLAPYFQLMDKSGRRGFRAFLDSRYHNVDTGMKDFYQLLLKSGKAHLNFKRLRKIWPELKASVPAIKAKITRLEQLLEDFTAHQYLKDHALEKSALLHRRFRNRGVPELAAKSKVAYRNAIDRLPPGVNKLREDYLFYHLDYYDLATDHRRDGWWKMERLQKHLAAFSGTLELLYGLEQRTLRKVAIRRGATTPPDADGSYALVQALLSLAGELINERHELNEEVYRTLRERLLEHHEDLEDELSYLLAKYLASALTNVVNRGHDRYKNDLLRWLRYAAEWMPDTLVALKPNEYLNVVITAAYNGELAFARHYAAAQKKRLQPDDATLTAELAEAFCLFFEDEYTQARERITRAFQPHASKNHFLMIRAKTLLMRCCLIEELSGRDGYENFCKAREDFRVYLSRMIKADEITPNYAKAYLAFSRVCNRIFSISTSSEKAAGYQVLLLDVKRSRNICFKQWLTSMLEKELSRAA